MRFQDFGYLLLIVVVAFCAFTILAPARSGVQSAPPVAQTSIHDLAQVQSAGRDLSTVTGSPSISAQFIDAILCTYKSPACGKGAALYSEGKRYGIDPVYPLAFFLNESSFGRAGEARQSLSIGNLRCIPGARCIDGYAWFDSWEQGFNAWYALIKNLYIAKWHLSTVDAIIPVYAPAADHNVPAHYIAVIKSAVSLWRAGKVALP
jgi:hypothetical protein